MDRRCFVLGTKKQLKEMIFFMAKMKYWNGTTWETLGAKDVVLTATLDTTWSGTSAPYTKTVSVSGILSTDTPIIDVVMSGTYTTDEARAEVWGYIYRAVTANDSITFYAMEKPTVSLPIQIKVVR